MRSPDAFVLRRAHILLASARKERVGAIAAHIGFSGQAVRQVIHTFQRDGLAALRRQSTRNHTLSYCFDTAAAQRLRHLLHQSPRLFRKLHG